MPRPLTIVADDYGIGRQTSRGILDLAVAGRITAAVLMVNCPDAERAARDWLDHDPPADLGWHPNLTLDRPVLPASAVPSLVRPDGTFWPLGSFLRRIATCRISAADVRMEWRAQLRRFLEMVGRPPDLVNSHQHVSLFPPCDSALLAVLAETSAAPYVRRVVEHGRALTRVPGARVKRTALAILGRRSARRAAARGLAGCDWLAGVTDPQCVANDRYWIRWFRHLNSPGSVEICCHPGYRDDTLIGRDCDDGAGLLRRPREMDLLRARSFADACAEAGLAPLRPTRLRDRMDGTWLGPDRHLAGGP